MLLSPDRNGMIPAVARVHRGSLVGRHSRRDGGRARFWCRSRKVLPSHRSGRYAFRSRLVVERDAGFTGSGGANICSRNKLKYVNK